MKTSWRTLHWDRNVTKPWKIPPLSSFRNPVPWNLSGNHFPRCRRILLPLLLYVKRLWHNRHLINISVEKLFVRIQNVYGINMHQLSQNLTQNLQVSSSIPQQKSHNCTVQGIRHRIEKARIVSGNDMTQHFLWCTWMQRISKSRHWNPTSPSLPIQPSPEPCPRERAIAVAKSSPMANGQVSLHCLACTAGDMKWCKLISGTATWILADDSGRYQKRTCST